MNMLNWSGHMQATIKMISFAFQSSATKQTFAPTATES
jgi:hypothetical protein